MMEQRSRRIITRLPIPGGISNAHLSVLLRLLGEALAGLGHDPKNWLWTVKFGKPQGAPDE